MIMLPAGYFGCECDLGSGFSCLVIEFIWDY